MGRGDSRGGRRARPVGPGLAKARRARLPQRIVRPQCVLTRHAEETIFAVAERMTEGSVREGADGDTYFGSTMLTIDLERLATQWRGPVQGERIVEAMAGSVRARLRCMRLACADATSRHPDRGFGCPLYPSDAADALPRLDLGRPPIHQTNKK